MSCESCLCLLTPEGFCSALADVLGIDRERLTLSPKAELDPDFVFRRKFFLDGKATEVTLNLDMVSDFRCLNGIHAIDELKSVLAHELASVVRKS